LVVRKSKFPLLLATGRAHSGEKMCSLVPALIHTRGAFLGGEGGLHVVRSAAAAAGRVGRGLRGRRREKEMVHKLEAWSMLLTTGR